MEQGGATHLLECNICRKEAPNFIAQDGHDDAHHVLAILVQLVILALERVEVNRLGQASVVKEADDGIPMS
jgi:hypothetical protein